MTAKHKRKPGFATRGRGSIIAAQPQETRGYRNNGSVLTEMDSTPKNPGPIVVLAKVLVWVMMLHGALMIAVGSTLVLDPLAFSPSTRGGMDLLLRCFGFLVVFAGALNMLAAVLFFWRSAYRWFWVYLAVIMNVLLCVVALMGYGTFIYIRLEFGSVWWSCYMAVHVLVGVGLLLRHLSVAATKNVP